MANTSLEMVRREVHLQHLVYGVTHLVHWVPVSRTRSGHHAPRGSRAHKMHTLHAKSDAHTHQPSTSGHADEHTVTHPCGSAVSVTRQCDLVPRRQHTRTVRLQMVTRTCTVHLSAVTHPCGSAVSTTTPYAIWYPGAPPPVEVMPPMPGTQSGTCLRTRQSRQSSESHVKTVGARRSVPNINT